MFQARTTETEDKPAFYRDLTQQLEGLLHGEHDAIANAANTAALLFTTLPDLNWAGFYFLRQPDELVLGPFQGKPACVRIAVGRGVCGAAVKERRTMLDAPIPSRFNADDQRGIEAIAALYMKASDPL